MRVDPISWGWGKVPPAHDRGRCSERQILGENVNELVYKNWSVSYTDEDSVNFGPVNEFRLVKPDGGSCATREALESLRREIEHIKHSSRGSYKVGSHIFCKPRVAK